MSDMSLAPPLARLHRRGRVRHSCLGHAQVLFQDTFGRREGFLVVARSSWKTINDFVYVLSRRLGTAARRSLGCFVSHIPAKGRPTIRHEYIFVLCSQALGGCTVKVHVDGLLREDRNLLVYLIR
jgi:hypothetical protein